MFMKSPQIKQFSYNPRYYKPQEMEEGKKPRIHFKRLSHTRMSKQRSKVGLIMIAIILLFLLFNWFQFGSKDKDQLKIEEIIIEDIQ